MNKIWISSDLHFCHNRSFLYEPRGFSSIDEHDATIIDNWNKIVDETDFVYILGDIMLNDNEAGISRFKMLNGIKHIIWGNHCTDTRKKLLAECDNTIILGYATVLKYGKWRFYLSHYPTITGNYDENDRPLHCQTINLCGHTHTKDRFVDMHKGNIYHCELDCHGNAPVLIDDIITDLKSYCKKES